MIPHPLTLLFCWLIGTGLSGALGCVVQFAGELCADAVRYGWARSGFYSTAVAALVMIATFANGLFVGAAMRLLAEKTWIRAALWALSAVFLASLIGSSAPLRQYPAVGAALLNSARFYLWAPAGCFIGAYACSRFHDAPGLYAAEAFMRSWMFWERGGAQ